MVKSGGKIQTKERFVKSGKNKGKKNETTIQEQADLDISYLYRSQLEEKGYFKSLSEYSKPRTAMLAHKYQDKKHTLSLEEDGETFSKVYYGQPKLDGIRCFITLLDDGTVAFISRTNKFFTPFEHIAKIVKPLLNVGDILDGELFNPNIPFVNIESIVNSDSDRFILDELTGARVFSEKDIQFHMYDYIPKEGGDELPYTERLELIRGMIDTYFSDSTSPIKGVLTEQLDTITTMKNKFSEWVLAKYEGLMLRAGDSLYEFNERSLGLLKYKEMFDEEYQITDIEESPNEPGQPIFIVDLRNGQTCSVRKKGSKKVNEALLKDKKSVIGKWLTVQYQTKTAYDNLAFPVGLEIREGQFKDGVFVPST